MKHVALIFAGLVALGIGVLIFVMSRCSSAIAIGAGSFFALLGFALAIPAQLKEAKGTMVDVASAVKDSIGLGGAKPPC